MVKKLALFFTFGTSLKAWHEYGLVRRDTAMYERLCEKGWQVLFVTYGEPDDSRYLPPDSHIRVLPKPEGLSDARYGRHVADIRKEDLHDVDVIKSHQVKGAAFASLAAWRLGKPYVARCGYLPFGLAKLLGHETWRRRAGLWCEEWLAFKTAHAICVPSKVEADYIRRHYGAGPDRIHLCPNWIDTDVFRPDQSVQKHRRRVCFVGRFGREKQPLLAVAVVAGLKDVELLMIGGGPMKTRLERLISRRGVRATVLDRVPNEELPRHMNSSAVFFQPTLFEGGSPKTVLEAMACGLPVVGSDAFGMNEVFEDGEHGAKCRPDDVEGFRKALNAFLDDPRRRELVGRKARERVIETYSIERAVERELDLLARVVHRGRR